MSKKQVIEIKCDAPNCKRKIEIKDKKNVKDWTIVNVRLIGKVGRPIVLDLCPQHSKTILKYLND